MPSNYTHLSVTWYDETDNYRTTENITDDVIDLPIFTDTGSGEVNEARIILKAPYGRRITNGPNIIDKFDRIGIICTDLDGESYRRVFEIDDLIPSKDKGEGTILTLSCLGTEYHTQQIHFAKPFWFTSAYVPGQVVGTTYNENKGSKQPTLMHHDERYNDFARRGNGLPRGTTAQYEYGFVPASCYSIWLDLVDRQGSPVRDRGVFDFFELGFDTPAVDTIAIRIFSSGSNPGNVAGQQVQVIEKTRSVNPAEGEGIISNPTATRVAVVGDSMSGSLPTGHARYTSQLFEFLFRPPWQNFIRYSRDAKVQYNGKHYRQTIETSINLRPDLNPGSWAQFDMSDEFGDTIQYSPWTIDKAAHFVNAGANPAAATAIVDGYQSTGASCFDGNIVIDEPGYFQTNVDERIVGINYQPQTPISNMSSYADGIWPRGYRILCVGTGPFGSSTIDRNGVSIVNSVIERMQRNDGEPGTEWCVKYKFDASVDRMQIAVKSEAKVYQWNNDTQTFTDISASDLGNHCFHKWSTLKNVEGVDPRPHETNSNKYPEITKDGNTFATNRKSAIEITYDFRFATLDRHISREAYQSHGAWINMQFPIPVTTHNGISENVGDVYGGGTRSAATSINEPATLDLSNLGYTPTGELGFNHADSDALMALSTFSFSLAVKAEIRSGTRRDPNRLKIFKGRANMRCLMGDTEDNVWKYDFIIPERNGTFYNFDLPLSGFEIYRGRRPRYFDLNVADIIELQNPKELDVQNIFEQRNIKWIVIQNQDQYDEFGRFAPEGNHDITNTDLSDTFAGRLTILLDDVHFKKPILAFSGIDNERNLETSFLQREDVILTTQAEIIAHSAEQIEKFQHKEFDITTTGEKLFNIRFGDSFYFKDERLVSDADMPDPNNPNRFIPHTIKLVAKRVEYSVTRPRAAGRGGLQRRIKGIKRFT